MLSHKSDAEKVFEHMCPSDSLTIESSYLMSALYQAEFINRAQMRLMRLMIEDIIEHGTIQGQQEAKPKNEDGPIVSTKYMDQAQLAAYNNGNNQMQHAADAN